MSDLPTTKINKSDFKSPLFKGQGSKAFDLLRASFFEIFLEQKEFSMAGFGKIKLAYSFGNINGENILKAGVILLDRGNKSSPQIRNSILKLVNKKKLDELV